MHTSLSERAEVAAREAVFVAGPTAVGKTEIALALAEALNGEIVGADAFQVYEGLALLTAKPSMQELARVPHHLIGTIPLADSFNVARYLEASVDAICEIRARGRLPIVVGGTGLYFRALTRGLSEAPPADESLRESLNQRPLPDLLAQLDSLDPEAAATIDRQNPRRVTRALEVILLTGKPFSSFRQEWANLPKIRAVFLERSREELNERIDRRAISMFQHGVVEEVKSALEKGEIGDTAGQVIGLREIEKLLRAEISQTACIAAIQLGTRQYAKRQVTWFKREPLFHPVTLSHDSKPPEVAANIAAYFSK